MKGDINYFVSSGIGYDANYAAYGNDLYQNFEINFFDKPVSSAHAHSLNEVKQNIEQSLIQQFSLHGDPAIKLNYYKGHDYTLDPKSFKTIPENLQTDLDSFNIVFTAWNLGYEKNRDLDIKVQTHNSWWKNFSLYFIRKIEWAWIKRSASDSPCL